MRCETCKGLGEVLIGARGNIVGRLGEAVRKITCPEGCIGGVASCCDGACGGRADIANAPMPLACGGER
jgi:hypothetical protein